MYERTFGCVCAVREDSVVIFSESMQIISDQYTFDILRENKSKSNGYESWAFRVCMHFCWPKFLDVSNGDII